MPPVVTSFASVDENGNPFFVMSTPSVWRAGGVSSEIGLEMLMWPVLLHEAVHTLHAQTYGRRLDELSKTFPWSREDSVAWWQEHEAKLLHMVKNKRKDLSPQKLD